MKQLKLLAFVFVLFGLQDCVNKKPLAEEKMEARTPVTITIVSSGPMSDSISLNAVSSFLKKSLLKSSATGYVENVNAKIGDYVEKGQVLFTIKTKEASVFTSKVIDTIMHFSGKFDIKSSVTGIVTQVDKQPGDYVADGDQLCMISQKSSLVFLLNVPFEFNHLIRIGDPCTIELPDKSILSGVIDSKLSTVDAASQTQSFVVRATSEKNLPENLIAKIRVLKSVSKNSISLPKDAVLTDETEANFWVMKLLNDSIAVRIPITKGIETDARVEIVSPKFSIADKIILTGNYGLPDTALVQVVKPNGNE